MLQTDSVRVYFWIKWDFFDWTTASSITWSHYFSNLISQLKMFKVSSRFWSQGRVYVKKHFKTDFLTGWCNRIEKIERSPCRQKNKKSRIISSLNSKRHHQTSVKWTGLHVESNEPVQLRLSLTVLKLLCVKISIS